MIGRDRPEKLDDTDLVRAWTPLHEAVLEAFEAKVAQLRWRLIGQIATPFAMSDINNMRPDQGLFFGFGYDEKTTSVLVNFDNVFAQLMSQAAFGGDDQVFSYKEDEAVSRFDVLLFKDIMQIFYRQLHETLISKEGKTPFPSLLRLGEAISPIPFEMPENEDKWVKLTLNVSASIRPKEKTAEAETSDTVETSGDSEIVPEQDADKEASKQSWPEVFSISVILPQSLYNNSLNNRFSVKTADASLSLSLEDGSMFWKSRVEKSHTSLRAVVENREMTVAECTRLSIGQVIPLPGVSLQKVAVEAELSEGRIQIATGALGIHKTRRALRINDGIDPEFIFGADMLNVKNPVPPA